jgi:hypothetical protein
VSAATLICAITADLFHSGGIISRRVVVYAALLFAVMVVAGVVTYYYHMNEPADDDNGSDTQPTVTELFRWQADEIARPTTRESRNRTVAARQEFASATRPGRP